MLTVITGAPCSGKSTYARQHARPGDIIIDFDAIAQALGSPVSHGHDPAMTMVTMAARNAAINSVTGRNSKKISAWIIESRPDPARREWWSAQGARIVDLIAAADELHYRADADGRPVSWHQRIDQYLAGQPLPSARRQTDPAAMARTRW